MCVPSAAESPIRIPNPCPPLPKDNIKDKNQKNKGNDDEIIELQKQLLVSEKERSKLEIEKLKLEKEKLVFEINLLKMKTAKMEHDNEEIENPISATTFTHDFHAVDDQTFAHL